MFTNSEFKLCCDNANVSICAQERFETDDVSFSRAKFLECMGEHFRTAAEWPWMVCFR